MNTRSRILQELRTTDGWLNGQSLSRKLEISRAAVSKHVAKLQKDGYKIESAPNRGYRLRSLPDTMSADEVLIHCPAKLAAKISYHHREETTSTNQDAHILATDGAPEYTLVVAESQSAGRGRRGREWLSPAGSGIYATILLRPPFPPEDAPLLTLLAAVVTAEAIKHVSPVSPAIKWPNDILLEGRKIAGILTEISTGPDLLDYALIGFGININTAQNRLPRRPIYPAGSLASITGRKFKRAEILACWLKIFATEYRKLLQGGREQLLKHWLALSNIKGKKITVRRINDSISGNVSGIDSTGALLLQTDDNCIHTILSGDIVPPDPTH